MKYLSIIIPAYNVEKYIDTLMDSIFKPRADITAFEVIIIDDGSDDRTAELCDRWAEKYSNIIIMHQPNSGSPAGPRNKGILSAKGEYIFFADADDYFYPNAVNKIIDYIKSHDTDVVLFKVDNSDRNDDYNGLYTVSKDNCNVYNSKIMSNLGPSKLFKRKLILDNHITFPENSAFEDLPFVMESYMRAHTVSIVADEPYYKRVKRTDEDSLSSFVEKGTGVFWNSKWLLKGIGYYLGKCKSLKEPTVCPQIYVRAINMTNSLIPNFFKQGKIEEIGVLSELIKTAYCDEIRSLLPFSKLSIIDALVTGNYELLKAFIESFPDGPKTEFFFDMEKGKQYYKCIIDDHSERCLIYPLPEDHGWGREKLEDPHITRNLITEARLTASQISFKGHIDFVRKLDNITDLNKNNISAGIRLKSKTIDKISTTKAVINNLKARHCFASVWQYEFDWGINLPLSEFMDEIMGDKQELAFFLDVSLGKMVIENRFGHRREKNVINKFFENAVLYQDWVLTPKLTGYNNISLDIIPRSMIEKQVVNISFVVNETNRKIYIAGNQGFDNYLGTKIFAIDDGHLYELQKGNKKGEREFKGSIPATQIDNHVHSLIIKSEILGGTLDYSNIRFSYKTSVRHITLKEINKQQEKIRLLEEEINALKNSKSWKMTKPLRDIANKLRKK